jgi:hypothetical protein
MTQAFSGAVDAGSASKNAAKNEETDSMKVEAA